MVIWGVSLRLSSRWGFVSVIASSRWRLGVRRNSLRMITLTWVKVDLFRSGIDFVIWNYFSNNSSYIGLISQPFQKIGCSWQLPVLRVIIPRNNWHCVFRLKHIGDRWVIHDNNIGHLSAQASHVLHIGITEPGTMLSEKFVRTKLFRVNYVHQRICILRETCSEDHELEVFMHSFEEWRHSRSN